ncbi:YhcN/YlaJ family sporulation lipoprotein [Sutcliffiella cohnii]
MFRLNWKSIIIAGMTVSLLTGCGADQRAERGAPNEALDVNWENRGARTGYMDARNVRYNEGMFGTNDLGTERNRNNMNINNTEIGRDGTFRSQNAANESRMAVADRAVDAVTDLEEVKRAYIIVTNRIAYVAAVLDDGHSGQLTEEVENKIAREVRKTDRDIQKVYVSTNPEFVDRMQGYINNINEGRPIAGFFEEFTETISRIFPNAR